MRLTASCLALLASLIVSGDATPARAESAVLRCVPGGVLFDPPAGDVPANWPLFLYTESYGEYREWASVRLVRVSDGAVVPAAAVSGWRGGLAPREDLVPGEDYDLYQPHCLGELERSTRYRATAPIAAPSTLGTVSISPVYAAYSARGATNRYYFVDVFLAHDAGFDAPPWSSVMQWNAEFDGSLDRSGSRPLGAYGIRAFVSCGATTGAALALGEHSVRGVSYAIFDAVRFSTPAITHTISVDDCAAATPVNAATMQPLTPEEIAYWDEPEMDAGVPVVCDPSMDGGRLCMSTERDTNSNCSIARGRRGGSAPWVMSLVAALLVVRRRRSLVRRRG
jgi:hypothetical protein